MRWRRLFIWFFAMALLTVYGILMYYPTRPHSWHGWLAMIAVGVPFLLLLEYAGSWIFARPFFDKLPAAVRVMMGVVIMTMFMFFIASIFPNIASLIEL